MMEIAESGLDISIESIAGSNSFWVPTPLDEVEELQNRGIIDIGENQSDFQKLVSLVHEIGHVIFSENKLKDHRRIKLFEESLAWYLGYDYALRNGVEINLKEYSECVEEALNLYAKEIK